MGEKRLVDMVDTETMLTFSLLRMPQGPNYGLSLIKNGAYINRIQLKYR